MPDPHTPFGRRMACPFSYPYHLRAGSIRNAARNSSCFTRSSARVYRRTRRLRVRLWSSHRGSTGRTGRLPSRTANATRPERSRSRINISSGIMSLYYVGCDSLGQELPTSGELPLVTSAVELQDSLLDKAEAVRKHPFLS